MGANEIITELSDKLQIQTYSAICQSSQLGTTAENRLQIMLRTIQISCLSLATGNCYFPIVFLSKTVQKLCMHLTYLAQRKSSSAVISQWQTHFRSSHTAVYRHKQCISPFTHEVLHYNKIFTSCAGVIFECPLLTMSITVR